MSGAPEAVSLAWDWAAQQSQLLEVPALALYAALGSDALQAPPRLLPTIKSKKANMLRGGSSRRQRPSIAIGSEQSGRSRKASVAERMIRGSVAFLEAAVNIALDVPVEEVKLQVAQKVDKRRSILMGRHVKRHNPKMRDHSLKDVTLVTSPRPSVQKEKRALAPKLAAAAQSSPAPTFSPPISAPRR